MKTKELFREVFNLAMRLVGLLMLYQGVSALAIRLSSDKIYTAVVFLVPAWWLLTGAYPIARRAYPEAGEAETGAQVHGGASEKKADA